MKYNPEEECDYFIRRIKSICAHKGISIGELAERAELAYSTMNELMNGKTRPQVYTMLKICNALDVTVGELLTEDAGNVHLVQWEEEILNKLRKLSVTGQKSVLEYIDMRILYEQYGKPIGISEKR